MPGYYIHLAASSEEARKNESFVFGVLAPDLLKSYYKSFGLDGTRKRYDSMKNSYNPPFFKLEARVQEKEVTHGTCGLHYGVSSNPGIKLFLQSLSEEDKNNPFYRGYLWHLITDLLIYKVIDLDSKFLEFKKKNLGNKNLNELLKEEVKKLHRDWDKTNGKISIMYPDVVLPPVIKELDIVKFINEDNTQYIDLDTIIYLIDFLRNFNPITDDVDNVLEEVNSLIKRKGYKNG